jgi:hypothetical protein
VCQVRGNFCTVDAGVIAGPSCGPWHLHAARSGVATAVTAAAVAGRRLAERLGWRNSSAEEAPYWQGGWVDHHIDEF